jgi:hypothetical protein
MLDGKLDNTRTHQMGKIVVAAADLAPEVGIVLFALRYDAGLAPVACNPS